MRTFKWTRHVSIIALSVLLLMTLLTPIVQAQSPVDSNTTGAYNYPVKPGTDEWKAFTTHDEMLKACQIPEDILKNMSTKGLVETVLEYPLYGDMMAYNSIQQGFEVVAARFNGLSELFNRKDAGTELIAIYRTMNPQDIKENWGDIQKGAYAVIIANVEILLAQNKILDNLTEIQLGDLLVEARSKYTSKQQSAIYGQPSLDSTLQVIEQVSQRHYTPREYNSYVYTPNGSRVAVIVDRTEMSSDEIAYWNWWVGYVYPLATWQATATNKYNCHSYAWYSQSTSNNKWMNSPSKYWQDGSYTRVNPPYPYNGARMRYVNGDHSAFVLFGMYPDQPQLYYVLSKWGPLPLMYHGAAYCPYNSSTLYIYYRW